MGHRNIATTQRYTHLRPVHEIPAHERLADAVPIADLVTATRKRAAGKGAGKNAGTETGHSQKFDVETDSASVDNTRLIEDGRRAMRFARNRRSRKPAGTFAGSHSGSLEEIQAKTGTDRKLARPVEFR